MDALSMLTRCMQDEALRYLYVVSLQGSPRGMVLAVASGVAGAILAALAAWVQRRAAAARPLGTPLGSVE